MKSKSESFQNIANLKDMICYKTVIYSEIFSRINYKKKTNASILSAQPEIQLISNLQTRIELMFYSIRRVCKLNNVPS